MEEFKHRIVASNAHTLVHFPFECFYVSFRGIPPCLISHPCLYQLRFASYKSIILLRHEFTSFSTTGEMADWGPVVIGLVLFVLFTPGLLFQLPGKGRPVEFCNFQTSGVSIFVHTLLFFGFMVIFLIAIGVHISS